MFIDKNDPKKRFTVYLQRCLTHITSVCSTFDNMMEEDEKIFGRQSEEKNDDYAIYRLIIDDRRFVVFRTREDHLK